MVKLPAFNGMTTGSVPVGGTKTKIVDLIAVYCPQLDKCYIMNVDNCAERGVILRVDPPKNNQNKGINWAEDYILNKETIRRVSPLADN